jgi:hypothetical protein
MSTSGTYNYHPKVAQPNKIFKQMESGGFQEPFYFGGSQVPITLGIETEKFHDHPHITTNSKMLGMGLSKKSQYTTHEQYTTIMMPKNFRRV